MLSLFTAVNNGQHPNSGCFPELQELTKEVGSVIHNIFIGWRFDIGTRHPRVRTGWKSPRRCRMTGSARPTRPQRQYPSSPRTVAVISSASRCTSTVDASNYDFQHFLLQSHANTVTSTLTVRFDNGRISQLEMSADFSNTLSNTIVCAHCGRYRTAPLYASREVVCGTSTRRLQCRSCGGFKCPNDLV